MGRMARSAGAVLLTAMSSTGAQAKQAMKCGDGVQLCGVLALESGFGSKNYLHPDPVVHGLWPQVPPHGDSQCVAPGKPGSSSKKHTCYMSAGSQQARFQDHEWKNHGLCSGTDHYDDYFQQVCALSKKPLDLMNSVRDDVRGPCKKQTSEKDQEKCFLEIITEVRNQFPLHYVDQYNDQIMLSACAGADGVWKLAAVKDFPKLCGGSGQSGGGGGSTSSSSGVCKPYQPGPKCKTDSDCTSYSGCVRCAKSSKKCTDQKLRSLRPGEAVEEDAEEVDEVIEAVAETEAAVDLLPGHAGRPSGAGLAALVGSVALVAVAGRSMLRRGQAAEQESGPQE